MRLESVQSINCSDEPTNEVEVLSPNPKKLLAQAGYRSRPASAPRLSHRTLHPMRKARVQLRGWSRTWPQVLPLRQLPRSQTPARLCPPAVTRVCSQIPSQLPEAESSARTDLRYQSGASAKKGGSVASARISRPYRDRCDGRRDDPRQHAAKPSGGEPNSTSRSTGGHR